MTFICSICEHKFYEIEKELRGFYRCGNCNKVICDRCYPMQQAKYRNIKDILSDKNGKLKKCDNCSDGKGNNVIVCSPLVDEFYKK
jgi:hypothetical protein